MDIKLNKINSFKRELCVSVPWDDLKNSYQNTFNKYISNYTPKGGRKGKLNSFQMKQFKLEHSTSIDMTFKEDAMNEFYRKALEQESIQPINKAEITKLEFKEGGALEFVAIFEVTPLIKLPNYKKKYKINTIKYIASDQDVNMSLNEVQEKFSKLEEIKSKAETGHFINGDFQELNESGDPIPDKIMKNQYIKLGSGNFTGKFEKDFIGSKSGETIKTSINIGNKEVPYQVSIKKIENQIMPEVDDELAKKVDPKVKNLKDLRNKIRDNIQSSLDQEHKKTIQNAIIDYFTKKTKVDSPASMIDNYMEYIIQDMKQKDATLDEEKIKNEYYDMAEKNVQWYLIKNELIKSNNLKISNKEIDQKIDEFINQSKEQEKQIKEFYKKDENLNNLYEQLLNDKLFEQIGEFAINKITEKSTSHLRKEK